MTFDEALRNATEATAEQDNAVAVATKAAIPPSRHFLLHVIAGYRGVAPAAGVKLVTIKEDGVARFTIPFDPTKQNPIVVPLSLHGAQGKAVSAELDASGAAGSFGRIILVGFPA